MCEIGNGASRSRMKDTDMLHDGSSYFYSTDSWALPTRADLFICPGAIFNKD